MESNYSNIREPPSAFKKAITIMLILIIGLGFLGFLPFGSVYLYAKSIESEQAITEKVEELKVGSFVQFMKNPIKNTQKAFATFKERQIALATGGIYAS